MLVSQLSGVTDVKIYQMSVPQSEDFSYLIAVDLRQRLLQFSNSLYNLMSLEGK